MITNALQMIDDTAGNRYVVTREIGAGGQGTIYAVQHASTGAPAIVKLWHPHNVTPDAEARLDALIALRLPQRSPALCGPIARVEGSAGLGAVMPFAEGEPLEDHYEHTPYSLVEALGIAAAITKGLAIIETLGITHGDLASSNVMVSKHLNAYCGALIDFDNARVPGAPAPAFVGQEFYLAPELLAHRADPSRATDAFALAVLLHELLLRRHPFASLFASQVSFAEYAALLSKAVWLEDPALGRPAPADALVPVASLSRRMFELFRRALQTDPSQRPRANEWATLFVEALDDGYRCACKGEFVNDATRFRCPWCGSAARPFELRVGGRVVSLAAMNTVLGRDALGGNPSISREHVVVARHGFGARLTNLSANGTAVRDANGWTVLRKGETRALGDGDHIRFAVGVEGVVRGQ